MELQALLDRFGNVSQEADGWLAHCPSHRDSQASLRIAVTSDGVGLLKCRAGCETAEVVKAAGLTFAQLKGITGVADVTIADRRKDPLPPEEIAALRVRLADYAAERFEAQEYAARRFGVDSATFERLGLGRADDLGGGPRLVVPFYDPQGVALGFQARAIDPHARVRWMGPKNPAVGEWSRIGFLDGGTGWSEILVTEGPGDGLTAVGVGYDALIVRGAGLAGDELAARIIEWAPGRPVVLCGDGDNAGRSFSSSLAAALARRGAVVKVLTPPDGGDLTAWREAAPERFAGALIHAVTSAQPLSSTGAVMLQRDESRYPLTDLGNARFIAALAQSQGTAIRYVEEIGYLNLHDGVWAEDRLERSRALVHESADLVADIAMSMLAEAGENEALKKRAQRWMSWAAYCQSSTGIDHALKELRALPSVATRIEDLDTHHHLLAVRNGVVDLRSGELMAHNPDLLLTKRVDLTYNPEARAPRWVQFLHEVMRNDATMVDYIQRLVGYSITGETAEQCFSVLWGSGANGKTVFTATLADVFDPITETTPFSTFEAKPSGGIPNDLAALRAARLVFASEGEADKPMAEALLKRITGRDPVTARFLRKEFFTFRPVMQLFLATNNKPSFKGQDEGLWRRVKMIEWSRYFAPDERDHKLPEKLLLEAEGILAWAVEGAVRWYRDGLNDPEPIMSATKEYRATSDPLAGFLPGVYVKDPAARKVLGKDIFNDYLQWADEENLKPAEIVRRQKLYAMLEERGITRHAVNQGISFNGIRKARPSDFGRPESEDEETTAPPVELIVSGGLNLDDV